MFPAITVLSYKHPFMPFTFAHPAIILPLRRFPSSKISLTGLIIGSVVPDFEYFIRMKVKSNYSHCIENVLWFDLPLGLLIAFVYHGMVRDKLIGNMPEYVVGKFGEVELVNWNTYLFRYWYVVFYSILLGTLSHIFWDSFTHENGFFVREFAFLQGVLTLNKVSVPIYKILQHLSSLIGVIYIFYIIHSYKRSPVASVTLNWTYWIICVGIAVLVLILRFLLFGGLDSIGTIIVSCITAGMLGILGASIFAPKSRNGR